MSLFRVGNTLASLATSSSSTYLRPVIHSTAAFHTSTVRFAETQRERIARIVRKTNIEKKALRARAYEANRPHVVLGTRLGEEDTKWRNCDLAKILVTPEELSTLPQTPLTGDTSNVERPTYASYGLDGLDGDAESRQDQLDFLLRQVPDASAVTQQETLSAMSSGKIKADLQLMNDEERVDFQEMRVKESNKARQLARIVDLRNANARGIAFENRRRIIAAFSPSKNATDSGYPEVQVALLTMKIRNIWNHLMQRKKDIHSRRPLRLMVHQRAKMLKYIKRKDRDRYDRVLERVALDPESVEGELVV